MSRPILVVCVAALVAVSVFCLWPAKAVRTKGLMPHDAYIWQRAWTEAVEGAIAEHGTSFTELVVLNAEVSWKSGLPQLVRLPVEWVALRSPGRRIGIALRIGSYPGPFKADDAPGQFLTELASSLVAEAITNRLSIAELQIDFDCAETKLDGYAAWVKAIRPKVAPVPVTITALPAWLKRPGFKRLIAAADGIVLQVHSLEKPKGIAAPFKLCDPAEASEPWNSRENWGSPSVWPCQRMVIWWHLMQLEVSLGF